MGPEVSKNPQTRTEEDSVTYDRRGNEVERVMISDFGELMGTMTQSFGPDGLLKETLWSDPKGAQRERTVYSFANGKVAEIFRYDAANVLREKTVRTHDAKGRLIEETYFDPLKARAKTVFKNDENGNAVEMAFFLSDGKKAIAPVGPCLGAHRVTHGYDANSRIVAKTVFEPDGTVKKSWTYAYDDRGNILKMKIKSTGSTSTIDYKYEFDSFGNWIKSIQVYGPEDGMLELMLQATGKKLTDEEMRGLRDAATITSVRVREIAYY